eukprot:5420385-Ditylum_brightwellii.AAC.1
MQSKRKNDDKGISCRLSLSKRRKQQRQQQQQEQSRAEIKEESGDESVEIIECDEERRKSSGEEVISLLFSSSSESEDDGNNDEAAVAYIKKYRDKDSAYVQHVSEMCFSMLHDARWRCASRGKCLFSWHHGDDLGV